MKSYDLCKKYGFDLNNFEEFLRTNSIKHKEGFLGSSVNDSDVERIVSLYKEDLILQEQRKREELLRQEEKKKEEEKRKKEEEKRKKEEAEEDKRKKKAMAEMLITSGFTFDGYKITKYSGYISGDDCVTIPRSSFLENNKAQDFLCGALVKIRRQALKELKEAAYDLGCNAVIGVDFDYLTMDPQHASALNGTVTVYEPYVICVTANGNAVVIEKED